MKTFSKFVENQKIRLWVDDLRDLKSDDGIRKGASGDEVWVKTPDEAKELLSTGNVTSVSLDGDLGDDNNRKELSGLEITKYIQELAYYNKIPRLRWAIHTDNPSKLKYMIMDLKKADEFWDGHEQK